MADALTLLHWLWLRAADVGGAQLARPPWCRNEPITDGGPPEGGREKGKEGERERHSETKRRERDMMRQKEGEGEGKRERVMERQKKGGEGLTMNAEEAPYWVSAEEVQVQKSSKRRILVASGFL